MPSAAAIPESGATRLRPKRPLIRSVGSALRRIAWVVSGWIPLTPLGIIAIPLLLLVARWYGGDHPDLIVRAACFGGLALLALNVLAVVVTALALWIRSEPTAAKVVPLEVGLPARTGYRVGLLGWNPLARVRLSWDEPTADVELVPSRGGWAEQVTPRTRGEVVGVRRRYTIEDLFGLARIRFQQRSSFPVQCRPSMGRPTKLDLFEQFKPGDQLGHPDGQPIGDLVEMRRYQAGDPIKLVLWKVYARTGRVLVRTPERSVSPVERVLAYLVAGPGDEPAAGLARLAMEYQLLGSDVVFQAAGAPAPATTPKEAVDQIVRSVHSQDHGADDLDSFLGLGESRGTAACYLFVPPVPGPWLDVVAETVTRHDGPFRAVIGIDGSRIAPTTPAWQRLLLSKADVDGPNQTDLTRVVATLREAGVDVMVVDRQTGTRLPLPEEASS